MHDGLHCGVDSRQNAFMALRVQNCVFTVFPGFWQNNRIAGIDAQNIVFFILSAIHSIMFRVLARTAPMVRGAISMRFFASQESLGVYA